MKVLHVRKMAYIGVASIETLAQLVIMLFIINILELFGVSYWSVTATMLRSGDEAGIALVGIFILDLFLTNLAFNWLYFEKDTLIVAFAESLGFVGLLVLTLWITGSTGFLAIGISGVMLSLFITYYSLTVENWLASKLRGTYETVSV